MLHCECMKYFTSEKRGSLETRSHHDNLSVRDKETGVTCLAQSEPFFHTTSGVETVLDQLTKPLTVILRSFLMHTAWFWAGLTCWNGSITPCCLPFLVEWTIFLNQRVSNMIQASILVHGGEEKHQSRASRCNVFYARFGRNWQVQSCRYFGPYHGNTSPTVTLEMLLTPTPTPSSRTNSNGIHNQKCTFCITVGFSPPHFANS